jgi:hypothetical protein
MCPSCFAEHERRAYGHNMRDWLERFGSQPDEKAPRRLRPALRLVRAPS